LLWMLSTALENGADSIHLVDEGKARDVVFGGLAPNGFRLRLDSGYAVEDGNRAIEHAQRTLDLRSKIHVAGCVDNVNPLLDPLKNLVNALFLTLRPEQVVAADVIVIRARVPAPSSR
jgi:hypothetical protein